MEERGKTIASLTAKAREAYNAKDFTASLQQWSLMRTLFPEEPSAYWGTGEALRELKMFDQADYWLMEGISRFPRNYLVHIGYAWAAAHRGDWEAAKTRFAAAIPLSSENRAAVFGVGLSLYRLERYEEAQATLEPIHQPGQADTGDLLAILATRIGNPDQMIDKLRAAVEALPNDEAAHLALIQLLTGSAKHAEAATAYASALQIFPENSRLLLGYARLAEQVGRWDDALNRWEAVKTMLPAIADGYIGSANALRHLGRAHEAELVSAPATRLFPENVDLAKLRAAVAAQRHDWNEALKRWRAVQQRQPTSIEGYAGEAIALRESGDHGASEALAVDLQARFPTDPTGWLEYARSAQSRKAWPEAVERWMAAREYFPQAVDPWIGLARCHVDTPNLDAAEAAVQEALARFADNVGVLQLSAEIATRRRDNAAAEARWKLVIDKAPDSIPVLLGYAKALLSNGKATEAEQLLEAARARLGGRVEIDVEIARIAAHQRNWERALSLLVAAKVKYGKHHLLVSATTDMLWQVGQDNGVYAKESPASVVAIPDILLQGFDETDDQLISKKIMLRFESLGDSCEFGMVQRRFGAEPLSLLRWTGTPPQKLAEAIRDRFRCIGDPEYTKLDESNGEYVTRISTYGMFAHTFSLASATPFEKFYEAQCKRMVYLRDKLLEDIELGEKILTYGSDRLTDETIDSLHSALEAIGSRSTLLCVRTANDIYRPGTVERVSDNLLVGAISAFSTTNIAIGEWMSVCKAAISIFEERAEALAV